MSSSNKDPQIVRIDDGINWQRLTHQQARQLCAALLKNGAGAFLPSAQNVLNQAK